MDYWLFFLFLLAIKSGVRQGGGWRGKVGRAVPWGLTVAEAWRGGSPMGAEGAHYAHRPKA